MKALEHIRPEVQSLDPAWSAATLQSIFADDAPALSRARAARPRRVLAALAVAVSAVVAGAVAVTTTSTSAAFAVEQEGNGDVIVTVHRLTDSVGLESALRAHGITAQVTYLQTEVPSDLSDNSPPSACSAGEAPGVLVDPADGGGFAITLESDYLAEHRDAELSLRAAGGSFDDDWAGVSITWSDGRC